MWPRWSLIVVLPAATCLYCASRVPCLGCSWGVCDARYHIATSLCGRKERGWYAALATCAHLMAIQPVCRACDTVTAARVCGTSTTRRLQGTAHGTAAVPGGNGRASCVWVMPALLAVRIDRSQVHALTDARACRLKATLGLRHRTLWCVARECCIVATAGHARLTGSTAWTLRAWAAGNCSKSRRNVRSASDGWQQGSAGCVICQCNREAARRSD